MSLLAALISFENMTAQSVAIIRTADPRKMKIHSPKENERNSNSLYCMDPRSPCRCVSHRETFVDKQLNVHTFMSHSCTHEQDIDMFDRMEKIGVRLECAQIHSTLTLAGVKYATDYNSGCELRYT